MKQKETYDLADWQIVVDNNRISGRYYQDNQKDPRLASYGRALRAPFSYVDLRFDPESRTLTSASYSFCSKGVDYLVDNDNRTTSLASLRVLDHRLFDVRTAVYTTWNRYEVNQFFEGRFSEAPYGGFDLRFDGTRQSKALELSALEALLPTAVADRSARPRFISNYASTFYLSPDYNPAHNLMYTAPHDIDSHQGWREIRHKPNLSFRTRLLGPAAEAVTVSLNLVPDSFPAVDLTVNRQLTLKKNEKKYRQIYGGSCQLSARLPLQAPDLLTLPDMNDPADMLKSLVTLSQFFRRCLPR